MVVFKHTNKSYTSVLPACLHGQSRDTEYTQRHTAEAAKRPNAVEDGDAHGGALSVQERLGPAPPAGPPPRPASGPPLTQAI